MVGAAGLTYSDCGPDADWFVQEWFGDCIYTTWESVAFWIGMSSVLFWIVAQLPQFITNWRNQTAEALSPWFLFQGLAGDSLNLLGCVLTGDQLATQTFTATYFMLADCVLITQYIYYTMREKRWFSLEEEQEQEEKGPSSACERIDEYLEHRKQTLAEFRKRLPKITIMVSDLSEESEANPDSQHNGNQNHPVTSVNGSSGASMISHAMHSPSALRVPRGDHTNKTPEVSPSTSITRSVESRPKGDGHQHKLNAQCHPVTCVTGYWSSTDADASLICHVLHSPKAPHNPHADHISRASQTSSLTPSARSPEIGISPGIGRQRISHGQRHASGPLKEHVESSSEGPARIVGQFQSVTERNRCLAQNRIHAARHRKIPEIPLEQLFPSAIAMKRRLRRLVHQYGLECGPPSVTRLEIHHVKPSVKQEVDKQQGGTMTSKLGAEPKKLPVKAAACLAGLVAVGTSTNYFQKSGTSGPPRGLAISSRRLLGDKRYLGPGMSSTSVHSAVKIGRKLLLIGREGDRSWLMKIFGSCVGWGSSGLYFGSRFSQIAMNYQRRSADGLSMAMVGCAILGNTCMGVSILMRTKSWEDLLDKAPWSLGSMGTASLDIFIVLQAKYLDARSTKSAQIALDESTGLLA